VGYDFRVCDMRAALADLDQGCGRTGDAGQLEEWRLNIHSLGPRVRSAGAVIGTSGCPLHEQPLASEAGFSRPSFEHHVEGPLRGAPHMAEATLFEHLGQPRLSRLGAESLPDLLGE
jgi:hypothetical protein